MIIQNHNTDDRVFVIAEIGNNHEGDFDLAGQMVEAAARAGADAVKFQTIEPTQLVSVRESARIAQLQKFQFSRKQFEELARVASDAGVVFLSTPFDVHAVDWLDKIVPAWKVASCDNDFYPLLDRLAQTGKPVIISMGLGHHDQAQTLEQFFAEAWRTHGVKGSLAFLHCVVSYPTPANEAGLAQIIRLRSQFATPGYSDHTIGIKAAELAVAAGARIIEKHFTLDKNLSEFRDHQLSADPQDLAEMVSAIRLTEEMMGNSSLRIQNCESGNLDPVRRSLTALVDIPEGAPLSMENLVWVRPGGGLRPGQEATVIGQIASKPIQAGEQITLEHVS